MEFIPSELAVLRQVRDLFLEASEKTYRLTLLTSRWPAGHYDAYRGGYAGLVKRGLISPCADQRFFSITSAGLKAMAVTG
jgi:hypothetical protein